MMEQSTESNETDFDAILEKYDDSSESTEEVKQEDATTSKEDEKTDESGEEESIESKLEKLETSSIEDDQALDYLNSLGILKDGLPINFENMDQVKDLLASNHEVGGQEVAKMKEELESSYKEKEDLLQQHVSEFQETQQQFSQQMLEYQTFSKVLQELEMTDPEVYAELKEAFEGHMNAFNQAQNNPVINQQAAELKEIREEINALKSGNIDKENKDITKSWESELGDVQKSLGPKLRSLKVVPNWKSVQEKWASDNTGKMTVKEALYATHGEAISKALEAQGKLTKTRSESSARQGTKVENSEPKQEKTESRLDFIKRLAERHAS